MEMIVFENKRFKNELKLKKKKNLQIKKTENKIKSDNMNWRNFISIFYFCTLLDAINNITIEYEFNYFLLFLTAACLLNLPTFFVQFIFLIKSVCLKLNSYFTLSWVI